MRYRKPSFICYVGLESWWCFSERENAIQCIRRSRRTRQSACASSSLIVHRCCTGSPHFILSLVVFVHFSLLLCRVTRQLCPPHPSQPICQMHVQVSSPPLHMASVSSAGDAVPFEAACSLSSGLIILAGIRIYGYYQPTQRRPWQLAISSISFASSASTLGVVSSKAYSMYSSLLLRRSC
jgi:hypothetical protein